MGRFFRHLHLFHQYSPVVTHDVYLSFNGLSNFNGASWSHVYTAVNRNIYPTVVRYSVSAAYLSFTAQNKDQIQINSLVEFEIHRVFYFWFNGKSGVVIIQKEWEEAISLFNVPDSIEPEFRRKPVLKSIPQPLYTSFSLGRIGKYLLYA